MRTIVHIGAHRTATTSIQTALNRNEELLNTNNIMAIHSLNARDSFFLSLKPLLDDSILDEDTHTNIQRMIDSVYNSVQNYEVLIFSEENLIGAMESNLLNLEFYPKAMTQVSKFISLLPDEAEIVISVRNYRTYFSSIYTYNFMKTIYQDFSHFKDHLLKMKRGWYDVVSEIRSALPNTKITVAPFEIYSKHHDLFYALLGIPPTINLPTLKLNVTRSALALERLAQAMKSEGKLTPAERLKIVRKANAENPSYASLWTRNQRHFLENKYNLDLIRIKDELNVEFLEKPKK